MSGALALHSDRRLGELLERAGDLPARISVDGVPVFVKQVALTDLERRPENVMSTANLFEVPEFCQYGIGSPGVGAWRELVADVMTTGWVLAGRTEAFPLLYHWRVLPGAPPMTGEYADTDRFVAYWEGSPAVRRRLEALAKASASVVLFLEHVPHTLHDWMTGRAAAGDDALTAMAALVESHLITDVAFMNAAGLTHFDAHFASILTDGHRLYISDLGLATSPRFDLSPAEAAFLGRHRTHDVAHAITGMVNRLVTVACGVPGSHIAPAERDAFVRACAAGAEPAGAPPAVAAVISRYAPVAAVMNALYRDLFGVSRATPYPAEQVAAALAAVVHRGGAGHPGGPGE